MKKLIKWLFFLAMFMVTAIVAGIFIIPMFVDVQSYKPQIQQKISEVTGRPVTLEGDLNLSLFPWVGLSFSDLTLGNPEGYGADPFVRIKSFEARIKVTPLLFKEFQVKKFVLDGPELYLERKSDGQANWMGIGQNNKNKQVASATGKKDNQAEPAAAGNLPIESLVVGEFAITNGRVVFKDQLTKTNKEISDLNLHLTNISLDNPIGIAFDAHVDAQPITLQGEIGPVGKEPGKGILHFDLTMQALNQLKVRGQGSVNDLIGNKEFDVALAVASFSPRKMMAALDQEFPVQTADPKVLENISLNLKLAGTPTAINISDGQLTLDDSKLNFLLAIQEISQPNISFEVKLDSINLDRYLAPVSLNKQDAAMEAPKEATIKDEDDNKKEIDYGPLQRLVVNGTVQAKQLIAKGLKIENIEMKVSGKDGLFDLDPFVLDLYQGNLTTVASLNVQGAKPKTTVELITQNIQVGPLLRDSVKKDVLEGGVNANVSLQLEGDTPEMIKRTLNGKGELLFSDGAIVGVDIAGMARNIQTSFSGIGKTSIKPRTDFAELKVPFTLTNGLFNTNGTSLSSPLIRLAMTGNAHLVKETLNFKVKPKFVGTLKGQGDTEERSGVMVPILVEGTFKSPEFSPDIQGMVQGLAPKKEDIIKALINPDDDAEKKNPTKDLGKSVQEQGKSILKGFGFGN